MEPDDPPRKNYDFKERAFKRDNAPGSGLPPMPTAKELAMMAGHVATPKRTLKTPRPDDPNDVFAVLHQNRAVEQKHGVNAVAVKRVRSRRKRDYWLLFVPGNLLVAVITWQGRGNPFFLVCGLTGMVMFSLGVTWIMWQVMDDY